MAIMGRCNHFISALLGGMALTLLVHAQDQSGFISIDCGTPANFSYTEPWIGINYISDATFIDTGISKSISYELKASYQQQKWTLRSFPEGIRNCYRINITQGVRYLIRATFLHGNYDGHGNNLPEFDLHLGPNMWDTVKIKNASYTVNKELIHVPTLNYIHVCLVNTNLGTPFISAIELRPLNDTAYVTESGSLALFTRTDDGSLYDRVYRYGDDIYDRIWYPDGTYEGIDTPYSINPTEYQHNNDYQTPSVVMSTAATPKTDSSPLNFNWDSETATSEYYIYMHFAEVEKLKANQSRSFYITINGEPFHGPYVPEYLSTETLSSRWALTKAKNYEVLILKTENSALPPILNAVEIYSVRNLSQSETDQQDVDAITKIMSTYGVKKNWQGDPCVPQAYLWEGLNCSNDGYNSPRIISLDLSSSGFTGEISADISNLVMLQDLDLSNNSLTGPVLYSLSQLKYLRVLNLGRNNLSGSIPVALLEKSKNGLVLLSVVENPYLCSSISCTTEKKKKNVVGPIEASVGGLLFLLLAAAAIFWIITKINHGKGKTNTTFTKQVSNSQNVQLESKTRQFTYTDIQMITNNFETLLGQGGFGKVYLGNVDGNPVAVKIISQSAVQGYRQFQSEVEPFMRVHHRNLTTLVGYCNEGTNLALIYEYMAKGDLQSHISENDSNILSWECRIRIALDCAQGLEYLHDDCNPPIIHRDVKPSNILLNEKFQAKLADFGLSRAIPTDGVSYVLTVVAGTPGYLDPEYCKSNKLTPKSDVYSFGVVLQNLITGQRAIVKKTENIHISQWISSMIAKGDIQSIVDPRLVNGDFDVHSARKAVEISMVCVSESSANRPNMSQVVTDLRECLAIELAQRNNNGVTESSQIFTVNMTTVTSPFPR